MRTVLSLCSSVLVFKDYTNRMRNTFPLVLILVVTTFIPDVSPQKHALFVRKDAVRNGKRVTRQTSADQMVQNILQWLQEVYNYNTRKIRQGSLREYLPPVHTQKPRPFEPPKPTEGGYPAAGSITPQPPFSENPSPGTEISPPYPGTNSPSSTAPPEGPSTGYPSGGPSTGYPSGGSSTGYPSIGSTEGSTVGYPSGEESSESASTSGSASQPSTTEATSPSAPSQPSTTEGGPEEASGSTSTSQPQESSTPSPDENSIPSESSEKPSVDGGEDSDKHPPHIHNIDVECSKEMMTINIEFNREFNGIIYSKGYYNNPDCRYVQENSGQTTYSFTVNLNSCGTEFVNGFDTQGQSYLENVLVLQNEAGIQEVWDTIRAVRCLWEGNLKKALNLTLSVGMLNQEIVTFSGDTAMARLDIQMGKGPFAPPANGLIKIGEVMTLVVSVTGDPGFDIQVKDCRAIDSSGENAVGLTDEQGCVLKPKLFGAFQKTRNTGDSGASIIAYAFFNAFKFPDVMDLTIECNVDLCKTDCEMCPDPNQKLEPGRRKRDLHYYQNRTENDESVKIGKTLRVIFPEELGDNSSLLNIRYNEGICLTTHSFFIASSLLISLLCCSCLFSAFIWIKYHQISRKL
ncbi:uncharacterized protein LOC108741896 [Agrilus planipennis]|uniref:Uncharacterized protein LOC108741896 n=1 Tax=Agrilus planipennis TaxID=224129 RepID=A0A1W4X8F0_AGRPL|nr:uncharacterized protein LOC108741896 [Agrilus planipennis]